ncbi:MAG TPA: ParB/RepB/Spo0J family partition protein [Syntrophales bacterium]|jgi:ParB family chromosome partitioning protein|nr:ParB/RepB/Spo0J family partition protein [Syntrophales bacterium]HRT61798.1 ParB/RepB/Spo0J family partition protein [Syntrophales bacterium]
MPAKESLGKGLGAILPDILGEVTDRANYIICGIEELVPNRYQSRKEFDGEEQKNLVTSVRKSGIIQPIVVRRLENGYEIIAGERRWRAAQEAGLKQVPIIVREAEDLDMAEISLVENIQRADLNPIEEAEAFLTLMEKFGLSHEEISARVGKDRSTVVNAVRLLKLTPEVREALAKRQVTAGHARALLSLSSAAEQVRLLRDILKKGLNVRETELLVRGLRKKASMTRKAIKDEQLAFLEGKLSRSLMTSVRIRTVKNGGTIEIGFSSPEELDRLLGILMR